MGKKNAKNNTQVVEVEDVAAVELKKEKSNKKNNGGNNLKNSGNTTTYTNGASPKGSPKLGSTPLKASKGDVKKPTSKEPAIPDYKHDNWGHFVREMLVRGTTLLVALWVVTLVPVPPVDFQKQPDQSFLWSYLEGGLNKVEFVTQILIAAAASVVFDFFVVFYHMTNPPHPKFVLAPARKISIYVHLIAGITEITTGFAAFFIADHALQQLLVTIMSVVSIIHGFTGYYQVTVVFGAKGIMVPGYLYAITIHVVSAIRLYHQPTSFVFLFSTYLTLHIYVWCRFFVFIFRYFNTFQHYHYTIAITLSGALLFPYTMGPVGNFGFLFIGTLYCVLHYLVEASGEDLTNLLFSEHERYALISSRAIDTWKDTLSSASGAESSDKKRAREVFEQYDLDNDGKLSMGEIYNLVKMIGVPINTIARIIKDIDDTGDNAVDVDEFYRYVWSYGNIKERLVKLPHIQKHKLTEQELANLVFEMLDVDDSGSISKAELSVLLSQWGMPCYEADVYLAKYFADEKQMNKDLFFTDMKPIWEFAAREVFQA